MPLLPLLPLLLRVLGALLLRCWLLGLGRVRFLSAGVVQPSLDALALQLFDVFKLLQNIIHDAREVIALHALLAHLFQAIHHILQAHAVFAVAPGESLLHEPVQRLAQIARLHVVVRERVEHTLGVQIIEPLRAIPP